MNAPQNSPARGTLALSVRGLTRRYGRRTALEALDLDVPAGSIFGLLGPNGAGKSTLLRLILGLARPSAGEIEIFGRDLGSEPTAALEPLGALVDGPALHAHLSARENLHCFALLCGGASSEEVETLLARVGLLERADDRVGGFSYGMRMRMGLALALLRQPRLLLLDEPTDGLDPAGVQAVRALLFDLQRAGTTVVLSSHLLHEIEATCDRAAILVRGKLIAQGTLEELTRGTSLEARFLELTRSHTGSDGFSAPVPPPASERHRGSFRGATRAELFKLLRSRMTWAALVIAVALAIFGAARAPELAHALSAPRNGFTALAQGLTPVAYLLATLALIAGATSIAGETQDGTLRSSLARPIARGALLAGKVAALAIFLLLVQCSALLAAGFTAAATLDFTTALDAREEADALQNLAFGTASLWQSMIIASAASFLAALAIAGLSTAISVGARRAPDAILQAALTLAVFLLLSYAFRGQAESALFFTAYLEGPWQHLLELGEKRVGAAWYWGNNSLLAATGDVGLDRARAAWLALCIPAGSALGCFTLAWALFRWRDVRA